MTASELEALVAIRNALDVLRRAEAPGGHARTLREKGLLREAYSGEDRGILIDLTKAGEAVADAFDTGRRSGKSSGSERTGRSPYEWPRIGEFICSDSPLPRNPMVTP